MLWSALRDILRRHAGKEDDLIYRLVGLLGISIPPESIQYSTGLRRALLLLVRAMHVNQRLLVIVRT
jgi:hypothetical protein